MGLLKKLPGMKALRRAYKRISFPGSAAYWEERYSRGGSSGQGSRGEPAKRMARILNGFVREKRIETVMEFGCGDGNQLSMFQFPSYIGLDVSPAAVKLCIERFKDDRSKSFFLYDRECYLDNHGVFRAQLVISADVVYHLVEDEAYWDHLRRLFQSAERHVIIFSTSVEVKSNRPHVRHRALIDDVRKSFPEWRLTGVTKDDRSQAADRFERTGSCHYHFYERA